LKPRYVIENEWFDCPYPSGTILVPINQSNGFGPVDWEPGMHAFTRDSLDEYPYLTRKLNWWEDLKLEAMPEYVKLYRGHGNKPHYHYIHVDGVEDKWTFFQGKPLCVTYKNGGVNSVEMLEPATHKEFLDYIAPENKCA
jgi:hypothetical protein